MEELFDYLVSAGLRARGKRAEKGAAGELWERGASCAVAGAVRTGKTTFLKDALARTLEGGAPRECTLFLDLGDLRLSPCDDTLLPRLFDTFVRQSPRCRHETSYVFLDNVDAVQGWAESLARILDVYDVRFAVAGQSLQAGCVSGLQSRRPAEYVELAPRGVDAIRSDSVQIQSAVRDAVVSGLLRRADSADSSLVLAFTSYALARAAHPISVTKAAKDLSDWGFKTSRATLARILNALSDIRLVHLVGDYNKGEQANDRAPEVLYAADIGIAAAFALGVPDNGDLLRGAVFLELASRYGRGEVHSLRVAPGRAVDFAVGSKGVEEPRAVVHTVDERLDGRKLHQAYQLLDRAMLKSGLVEATLVTAGWEGEREMPAGLVRAMPYSTWAYEK